MGKVLKKDEILRFSIFNRDSGYKVAYSCDDQGSREGNISALAVGIAQFLGSESDPKEATKLFKDMLDRAIGEFIERDPEVITRVSRVTDNEDPEVISAGTPREVNDLDEYLGEKAKKAYEDAKNELRKALDKKFEDLIYLAAKLVVDLYEMADGYGEVSKDDKFMPSGQLEQLARGEVSLKDISVKELPLEAANTLEEELEKYADEEALKRLIEEDYATQFSAETVDGETIYQAVVTRVCEDCEGGRTITIKAFIEKNSSFSRDGSIVELMRNVQAEFPDDDILVEFSDEPIQLEAE